MYGSVVIHPIGGRAPGRKRLDAVARDIVRAFERAALLPPGTAVAAHANPTTDVVGCEELTPDVTGVSIGIDGPAFRPGIRDLIFAWTWAEYDDGLGLELPDGVTADQFVFPILTVSVYPKAVRATHPDGDLACRSWAMIEFSFEDVRVNLDEVHRIRDEQHPLFRELAAALNVEVGWSVVMY
jgi:hypothetical protein